ncbi:hypothetical protein PVK06_043268 [Gossypium arboreum]|uniref:Reverse transcriptase zinc-binding domain-containing protein n=1 Tax=Gossypium arboreum TaxID=29729 RepID=A0ABR0MQK3_GOSAR|nr:hypothetical protein PVK06_043268 [Gossypium arboreum]
MATGIAQQIKITNWRTSQNFLPIFANLHYRRLTGSAGCPKCPDGVQTVEQVFRDCQKAKEIWQQLNITRPAVASDAAKLGLALGILTVEIEGMSYPWYGNYKITESKDIENKSTCVGYQSCVFRHMPRQANGSAPMHGGFQEKRKVYQMFGIGPVSLRLAGFPFF